MLIHEVAQVVGADNANKKLAEGWKLLAVTGAGNGSETGQSFVWYVLGKPAAKKDPLDGFALGAHARQL